jgi:hypothetical protein
MDDYSKMKEECSPKIRELKLKGLSYKEITTQLQSKYPDLTESYVSKWGLRMLGQMSRYQKNKDGGLSLKYHEIAITPDVMERLEEARERLRVDLGRRFKPTHSETIKDLLDKC